MLVEELQKQVVYFFQKTCYHRKFMDPTSTGNSVAPNHAGGTDSKKLNSTKARCSTTFKESLSTR